MMKYFLVLSLLFCNSLVLANEVKLPLFQATSDAFDGSLEVNLIVNETSNATGLLYTLNGKDTSVTLNNLAIGVVLFQMSGKNVAVLSSKNFSATKGGPLTLTYLQDGIQDTYQKFNFALGPQGQSWNSYVTNTHGIPHVFISMYLTANKVFGNVIGIDHISVK